MAMTNNISVYGYDTGMLLENTSTLTPKSTVGPVGQSEPYDLKTNEDSMCYLLQLPVELRLKIIGLVLSHTVDTGPRGIAWIRGHCALLATCRSLYNEGIRLIYGSNIFVIDVVWDGIFLAYQWLLPTGLIPKRTLTFPGKLAPRNVLQIRQLLLRVRHVDNYTGMVKHNFGGPGLHEGLRLQVEHLCQSTLQDMQEITHLTVHFQNDSHAQSIDQHILKPLLKLRKTRTITFSGSITSDFQHLLKTRLTNAYTRNSLLRLPHEVRTLIYDLLLPRTQIILNTHPTQHKYVRWRKGHVEILRTCSAIHKEASSLLYRTRNFQLTCGSNHFRFTPFWLPDGRLLPGLKFPESIGFQNFLQIRRFTIYVPVWWAQVDEHGKREREAMLEGMGRLLRTCPRIVSLTLICFCWKLDKEWLERAMREILCVRGVGRVDIYGLDKEMARRFRERLMSE